MKFPRTALLLLLVTVLASSMVSFTFFSQQQSVSYEMLVNNKKVGVVKFAAKGLAYYDEFIQELSGRYPNDVSIRADVRFREINGNSSYTSVYELKKAMEEAVEIKTKAYAVSINDEQLCYVKTLQEAERLAEKIKQPYIDKIKSLQDTELEEVDFSENISFEPVTVDYDELADEQEALDKLQQNVEDKVEYTIQDDDTFWDIALKNDISVDEIISLNPGIDPERIKPGETIVLSGEKKLVNVVTKEIFTYEEEIPYETEEREDNTLLRGQTRVIQEGREGTKEIKARIIRENGIEVTRELIEEKVVEEPVKEIIAVGTKRQAISSRGRNSGSSNASSNNASSKNVSSKSSYKDVPAPSNGSVSGSDIVSYAKKFLGKPYRYAASGPNSFDCSGFTSYVYRQFGYSLSRSSRAQALNGTPVSNLAPGDVLLFTSPRSGGAVGHVGIYIGNGNFIHASSGRGRVVIDNLYSSSYYSKRYKGARRIIK